MGEQVTSISLNLLMTLKLDSPRCTIKEIALIMKRIMVIQSSTLHGNLKIQTMGQLKNCLGTQLMDNIFMIAAQEYLEMDASQSQLHMHFMSLSINLILTNWISP